MILTLTPNPCVDKTIFIDELKPGTFIRAPRYSCIAGGKGTNVARAAKILGAPVQAVAVVGGHTGRHVVEMIEGDGIDCLPVNVQSATRTITTVLEEPIHRQTALFEPGSRVTSVERDAIISTFSGAVRETTVAAFCGTVSDPAIADLYAALIPVARAAGALPFLDSHGPEFRAGIDARPHLVKPNVAEASEYLGRTLDSRSAQWEAVDQFHELGVEVVVLSLGKDGALVSNRSDRFHVMPPKIDEVNPVGSGDALLAGFAVGFEQRLSLEAMARLGVAAGTANAMSWDIGHFTKREVDETSSRVRIERGR